MDQNETDQEVIDVQPAPPPPPADSPQCSSPSSAGTLSDPAGRPKTPRRSHPGNDVKFEGNCNSRKIHLEVSIEFVAVKARQMFMLASPDLQFYQMKMTMTALKLRNGLLFKWPLFYET